jgi:hypothetical protein
MLGLFLAPVRLFGAFVRGRHSSSLYRFYPAGFREELLDFRLGKLRDRLGLSRQDSHANVADVLAFSGWVCLAFLFIALIFLTILGLLR